MVKLQLSKRIFENPIPTEENTTELFTDLILYDELNMDKTLSVVIHKENKVGMLSNKSTVYDDIVEGKTLTVISKRLGKELRESYRITEVREDTQQLTKQITGISKFFDFGNMLIEESKVGIDTVDNYIKFLLGNSPINWKITIDEPTRKVEILEPLGEGEDRIVELKRFLNMIDYEMYIGEDFSVHFQRRYYAVMNPYKLTETNYSDLRIYKSSADVHTIVKLFYKDKEYLENEEEKVLKEYLYTAPTIEKHGYIRHKDIYLNKAMNLTDVKRLAAELIQIDAEIEYELDIQFQTEINLTLGSYVDIYKTGKGKLNDENVRVTSTERQVNINNELEIIGITLGRYKLDYDISSPTSKLTTEVERKIYNVADGKDYGKPTEGSGTGGGGGTIDEVNIQDVKFPNLPTGTRYRYGNKDYINDSNLGNVFLSGDRKYTTEDNANLNIKRTYGFKADTLNYASGVHEYFISHSEEVNTSKNELRYITKLNSIEKIKRGKQSGTISINSVFNNSTKKHIKNEIEIKGNLTILGEYDTSIDGLSDKIAVKIPEIDIRVGSQFAIGVKILESNYGEYSSIVNNATNSKINSGAILNSEASKVSIKGTEVEIKNSYCLYYTNETIYNGINYFTDGLYVTKGLYFSGVDKIVENKSSAVQDVKYIRTTLKDLTNIPVNMVNVLTTSISHHSNKGKSLNMVDMNKLIARICEAIHELDERTGG